MWFVYCDFVEELPVLLKDFFCLEYFLVEEQLSNYVIQELPKINILSHPISNEQIKSYIWCHCILLSKSRYYLNNLVWRYFGANVVAPKFAINWQTWKLHCRICLRWMDISQINCFWHTYSRDTSFSNFGILFCSSP